MNDKERVLTTLLGRLYLGRDIALEMDKKPKVGDLVYINFFPASDWSVGRLDSFHPIEGYMIREVGSDRLCHCYNCTAIVVKTEGILEYFEGKEYLFVEKAYKVFIRSYYITRLSDIEFEGKTAYVSLRKRWSGFDGHSISVPMNCTQKKLEETIGPDGSQFSR